MGRGRLLISVALLAVLISGYRVQATMEEGLSQLRTHLSSASSQSDVPDRPSVVIPRVQAASVQAGGVVLPERAPVSVVQVGGEVIAPVKGGQPPAGAAAVCPCCGIIWHAENQVKSEVYDESPVGGLEEACWITGQIWTDQPGVERFTFAIRPGTVVWFAGHRGGTAWYFAGDEAAVWEDIKKQARQLEERDGPLPTGILMLPDQADLLRLVVRVQTRTTSPTASGNPGSGQSIAGPAIFETSLEDGRGLVVKVNSGQNFVSAREGTHFPFESQSALDERWDGHKGEFFAKHPDGEAKEV